MVPGEAASVRLGSWVLCRGGVVRGQRTFPDDRVLLLLMPSTGERRGARTFQPVCVWAWQLVAVSQQEKPRRGGV